MQNNDNHMTNRKGFIYRVFDLYYDGFKNMTIGKTLWTIIIIKLIIIFLVLKLFFFPNFISSNAEEGHEDDFVMKELTNR